MDRRDQRTWVVLELSPQGERLIEEGGLDVALRRYLRVDPAWPVFIPSRHFERCGKRITVHLMEGYAFIASGLDEIHYFRLERSRLVEQVMAIRGPNGVRVLSVVSEAKVAELRQRLLDEVSIDIAPGMSVRVTQGLYAHMTGSVEMLEGDHAGVYFDLESLKLLAWLPKAILDTTDQEAKPLPKILDVRMGALPASPTLPDPNLESFEQWLVAWSFEAWLKRSLRDPVYRFEEFLRKTRRKGGET